MSIRGGHSRANENVGRAVIFVMTAELTVIVMGPGWTVLHVHTVVPAGRERDRVVVLGDGIFDLAGLGVDDGGSSAVEGPEATTRRAAMVFVAVQDARGRLDAGKRKESWIENERASATMMDTR